MIHSKRLLLILLALVILTFLVVACGDGSQIAGTPTPEAKVKTEPTPTEELLKPESTESPSPTKTVPSATSGPVPSTDTPTSETKVETKPSPTEVINWDQAKDHTDSFVSGTSILVCGQSLALTLIETPKVTLPMPISISVNLLPTQADSW